MTGDNLFPSIGTLAQQAEDSKDLVKDVNITGTSANEDEERVVQEIESYCVNCEEQVTKCLPLYYFLT